MTNGTDSHETPDARTVDVEQLMAAMSGLTQRQIEDVLQGLLAARAPLPRLFGATAPPSRRRPRRPDVVTYRVRIDLKGTRPPLWRRLELASDLFLDQVHEIIQVAFGWTDSHLHQFGSGPGHYGPETEHYLCPFQVEDGETGVPEEDVRLDEVLVDAGDRLFYDYDFGDGWEHVIKLEALLPRPDAGPGAVCVAGRRDGPAEDCGGIYAYELISAATDPGNPIMLTRWPSSTASMGSQPARTACARPPSTSTRSMRRWPVSYRWTSAILPAATVRKSATFPSPWMSWSMLSGPRRASASCDS